ncbi:MAG: hypothetical protein H7Y42_17660 [Chitinophagaceae bacterium]|nr:hypothetical protein [Chitinophagaceae bacterium]
MKRILQTAALALVISLGGSLLNAVSAQPGYDDYDEGYQEGFDQQADVSYQTFYDELSPHGRWIDYPEHGYVWVPNNLPGFRPYETAGHWVWTEDYESMWVSDYSWGWAPFHYGRWFNDPFYGWMWVPGYEWSPAWVAWRDGGEYYGWAPLRPGINISINIGVGRYNPPMDYWVFAPRRYINSPRIYDYCIDRGRNVTIINNTTIINNYSRRNNVFINGPRRMDVQRYAGRINPVRFRESSRPGRTQFRNNEVSVYRPRIQQDNNRRFTPRTFDRYERTSQSNSRGLDRIRENASNRGSNGQVRQQDNTQNSGTSDNRRFGRRNDQQADATNNERTPGRMIQRGNDQTAPTDRPARRLEERSNNEAREQGTADNNRRFERRSAAERQPQSQERQQQQQPQREIENRQREQQQEQQRQFGNRQREQQQQQQQQRQVETRQREQQQQQQRQAETRQREQSQGQQRQFETRQREQQQSQPRTESRGNSGNREQKASSDNTGPRRFGRRD